MIKLAEWQQTVESDGTNRDQVKDILWDWKAQNKKNVDAVQRLFVFVSHDRRLMAHKEFGKLMAELAESVGLAEEQRAGGEK